MKKFFTLVLANCIASLFVFGIGTNDVSITRQNDLLLFTDHNGSCAPTNAGMHAAYIAYKICNTTSPAVTLTNLQVTLGSFTNTQFGLAGGQSATQFIGSLAPGECDVLYWFIYYPCVWNPAQTTNLTVTVSDPPAAGVKSLTETYTTWRCQSTLAGGDVISASVSGGTSIGSIVTLAVNYQFGQASVGDAYWLQPAGNITPYYSSTFNAGCFQLLNSKITASTVTGIPVGTQDQLYFLETTPHGGGQTYNVTVEYYFEAHCATSTVAVPYAAQHSGNQDKYTGNYGQKITTFPTPSTGNVGITKTVSPSTVVPGNLATYTVTISNTSTTKIIIDTIVDQLPTPLTFNATDNSGYVKTTNSNTSPALGQTGTLRWIGGDMIPGDFPYTYYTVPANGSITLVYTARVPLGTSSGTYINDAYFIIGQYKSQHVQAPVYVGGDLSITKTDGKTYYGTGNNTYTIVVSNAGPGDITGATVTDYKPGMATSMTWQVTGTTGGSTVDGAQNGTGDLVKTVNIPKNGTITFQVVLVIPCGSTGTLTNTATVTPPANVPDPNTSNNTATDDDYETVWTGNINDDWDNPGNWTQGEPACDKNAVIPNVSPKPNPVISSTANFADNLTIQQGAQLTIDPGMDLKVCGCTQINDACALYLKADSANGNSSFVTTQDGTISYANDGTACVELYLTACDNNDIGCWHYVSSPVTNERVGVFSGDYLKSFDEVTGTWSDYYTHLWDPMNVLQGYIVSNPTAGVRTFRGQLNDGNVQASLTRTLTSARPGWNLVGNPYASEIDLNSTLNWTDVDQVVYYYNQQGGNYLAYLVNPYGFGLGTRYIPSMQGFFIHVYDGGAPNYNNSSGIIRFSDDNRTTTGNVTFYKDLPSDALTLKVQGQTNLFDQMLIYFNQGLSTGFERNFDAMKLAGASGSPQIYSVASDNTKLTIDGRTYEGINTIVPVDFYVNKEGTDNYTITSGNVESFRPGTTIVLEDKKTQITQEITSNHTYTFSYTNTDNPSRFLLHFFNPFYGLNDTQKHQDVLIYSFGSEIYVKNMTGNPQTGDIFVYNLLGQELAHKKLEIATLNKFGVTLPGGYYLVQVITKDKTYNGKVYLE